MLLEYMPFRACEPVLKTILSVSPRCWVSAYWSRRTTGYELSQSTALRRQQRMPRTTSA